jgi:hypothetical protein
LQGACRGNACNARHRWFGMFQGLHTGTQTATEFNLSDLNKTRKFTNYQVFQSPIAVNNCVIVQGQLLFRTDPLLKLHAYASRLDMKACILIGLAA